MAFDLMAELLREPTEEHIKAITCHCGELMMIGRSECSSCELHRLFPEAFKSKGEGNGI